MIFLCALGYEVLYIQDSMSLFPVRSITSEVSTYGNNIVDTAG